MPKYRTKPFEIEAYQLTYDLIKSAVVDGNPYPADVRLSSCHIEDNEVFDWVGILSNSKGYDQAVSVNDWIVTEPDGKGHYPVSPEVFAKKYELVTK